VSAIGRRAFSSRKNLKALRLSRKTMIAKNAFAGAPVEFFYMD
jgi:hypothetical protein